MFNVGKREGVEEWSALEHRPQFERKMATGILFRVELAHRLRAMGFDIEASGPYFSIRGISETQREALSTRSKQIAEHMQRAGFDAGGDAAGREIAALNSRAVKSEPPLRELLELFEFQAAQLGITPASVWGMRGGTLAPQEPLEIDHAAILTELMESQSCATSQEALCLICEKAMGRLSAAECLAELDRFLAFDQVVHLGRSELLTHVFTSKATLELEATVSRRVAQAAADRGHRLDPTAIEARFAALERELSKKLGVPVSLAQQRDAALHVGSETGRHAFVEGLRSSGRRNSMRPRSSSDIKASSRSCGPRNCAATRSLLTRRARGRRASSRARSARSRPAFSSAASSTNPRAASMPRSSA